MVAIICPGCCEAVEELVLIEGGCGTWKWCAACAERHRILNIDIRIIKLYRRLMKEWEVVYWRLQELIEYPHLPLTHSAACGNLTDKQRREEIHKQQDESDRLRSMIDIINNKYGEIPLEEKES